MKRIGRGRYLEAAVVIIIFFLFSMKTTLIIDADFGWHLKAGEDISGGWVSEEEQYTYTMPSFSFVNHEWLSDVFIYHVFSFNPQLLNALFAGIVVCPFIILAAGFKKRYAYGIFAMAALAILPFVGVRMQVLSWLFYSAFLFILLNDARWKRLRLFFPLGFLLWANLHGGFILAILLLWVFVCLRFYERRLKKEDVAVVFLSTAATLINPYGFTLWPSVISQTIDFETRLRISEWLPGVLFLNLPFLFLISITGIMFARYYKKISKVKIAILAITLILAITSVRNVPFFVITILAVLPELIAGFVHELKKSEQKKRLQRAGSVLLLAALLIGIYFSFRLIFDGKTPGKNYPEKAVEFLRKNKRDGRLFSDYNWGGYLIWKYPEEKVFIDGRMPSWRQSDLPGESASAMSDYLSVISGRKNYMEIFEKYNIKYVLLPTDNKFGKFTHSLENAGWKIVYKDDVSVVWISN